MTLVELVQVRTADGVRLDGALAVPKPGGALRRSVVDAVLAPPAADNSSPAATATAASSRADNSTADAGGCGAVATVVPQATDSLSPSDAQARKLQSILSSLG